MRKVLFYSKTLCFCAMTSILYANGNINVCDELDTIIPMMSTAIRLNEQFKNSVSNLALEDQKVLRIKVENYYEDTLIEPLIDVLVKKECRNNKQFIKSFLELIKSFVNSADEQLNDSFSELYIEEPLLVETSIKTEFSSKDKKILIDALKGNLEKHQEGGNSYTDAIKRLSEFCKNNKIAY